MFPLGGLLSVFGMWYGDNQLETQEMESDHLRWIRRAKVFGMCQCVASP